MPLGDGATWDEANPQQSTLANLEDSYNRDVRAGVRVRLNKEHIWPASQTGSSEGGPHTYITFQPQTAAPSLPLVGTTTQCGGLYFDTNKFGYLMDSAGTSYVIFQSAAGFALSKTSTAGAVPIVTGSGAITLLAASTAGLALVSAGTGNPAAWGKPSVFGAWSTAFNFNQAYQATSDCMVCSYAGAGAGGGTTLRGFTDSTSNPAAKVVDQNVPDSSIYSITFPVIKNDYFKVTISVAGSAAGKISLLPIGT